MELGPNRRAKLDAWGGNRPRTTDQRRRPTAHSLNRTGQNSGRPQTTSGSRRHARSLARPRSALALSSSRAKPVPRPRPTPPVAGAWKKRTVKATPFRTAYNAGSLPINVEHGTKRKVQWKADITTLDLHHYLPIFFEGLREVKEPYCFLAYAGVMDILEHGASQILPVVPQLILPIKAGLNTRDRKIICVILKVLQALVKCAPLVGEALVPYFRQILPICNLVVLLEKRKNIGDQIEYGQRKREDLIDLVNETLALLELNGGDDAFINIKYLVPTYESCA